MKGMRRGRVLITLTLILVAAIVSYIISPFGIDNVVHGDVVSAETTDWYVVRKDIEISNGGLLLPNEYTQVRVACSAKGGQLVSSYNVWGGGDTICAVFKLGGD
ncbi:MAG TPA: hypothetical protein VNU25_01075 [Candidatus Paceibacterota bacterium]|nr:hypothetical protein [Candidatus Paceibacterota bacterium]